MKKTYQIAKLLPGQPVSIANCAELATVIRQIGGLQNLYLVNWRGKEMNVARAQLAVSFRGRFVFGPYSTDMYAPGF